ncbi:MAG: IS200/IS605 family transposase [Desulfobulbaceae bacterium]|nr:IS200/IS605 family transposase [Desulfobulbaceae bacterium]
MRFAPQLTHHRIPRCDTFAEYAAAFFRMSRSNFLHPKYRFCILEGQVGKAVEDYNRVFSKQQECEIVELNIQPDHVHLLVMIPPKVSVSDYVGKVKA